MWICTHGRTYVHQFSSLLGRRHAHTRTQGKIWIKIKVAYGFLVKIRWKILRPADCCLDFTKEWEGSPNSSGLARGGYGRHGHRRGRVDLAGRRWWPSPRRGGLSQWQQGSILGGEESRACWCWASSTVRRAAASSESRAAESERSGIGREGEGETWADWVKNL